LKRAERLNQLKADEQSAAFALQRGVEKLGKGDVPGAIVDLEEAVRLGPKLPRAHYQLAIALRRQGAHGEARAHFAEARRLAPYLEIPGNTPDQTKKGESR
jgi:Tfp pilus assembly protein PilF